MTREKEPRLNKFAPKIRVPGISYGYRRDEPGTCHYYLNVDQYVLHEYVIWRVYHWYDTWFPIKVPGFRKLEALARKMGGEHRLGYDDPDPRLRDRLVAWTVNQDIRCYELGKHKAKSLLMVEVTEEQYREYRNKQEKKLDEAMEKRREERARRAFTPSGARSEQDPVPEGEGEQQG